MVTKQMRTQTTGRTSRPSRERGFTYLWVLVAVAIAGLELQAVSELWVTTATRQKTEELEWVGQQFTRAIGSYYQATPGVAKAYPSSLSELIDDRRYLTARRHLRAVYVNPFTGKADWELIVEADGRLHGVSVTLPADAGPGGMQKKEFRYAPDVSP